MRTLKAAIRSALVPTIGLAIVLAGGCTQPVTGSNPPATQSAPSAPSEASLEELRSMPASEAMAGPAVPEIFTQADATRVVGHNDFKIIAQESPS